MRRLLFYSFTYISLLFVFTVIYSKWMSANWAITKRRCFTVLRVCWIGHWFSFLKIKTFLLFDSFFMVEVTSQYIVEILFFLPKDFVILVSHLFFTLADLSTKVFLILIFIAEKKLSHYNLFRPMENVF